MAVSPYLAELRVLDFCWVGAGAFVTKMLADLGADVIKIESRSRPDNLRVSPPRRPGTEGLEASGYFASRNSNKRSFALDMGKPESRAIARRLAAACSVVTSNFRPGVLERWGLGYDDVRVVNPEVIYLTMPMQGGSGPHRSFIGFGSTISALAGLTHLSGDPDRPPVGTGTHYPDHVPNPGHALVALLAALYHRERTGEGQAIEVSQLESTINVLGAAVIEHSAGRTVPVRSGNRAPHASPRGVFACCDGDWVAVSATSDEAWRALAEVVGHANWADDDRFATLAGRKRHEDELEELLRAAIATCRRADLVQLLRARGVAAAPVNSSRDVLEDPDLAARGYWQQLDHPVIGPMSVSGPPFRIGGQRPALRSAPLLGEHTREIAHELLGMEDDEIDRLAAAGILQ